MTPGGQPSRLDGCPQQENGSGRSPSAHAAALTLPPIADLDYGFRFSGDGSGGRTLHAGRDGTRVGTPIFGAELRFSGDGGLRTTALDLPGAGPVGDGETQWGLVGMGTPSKIHGKGASNDGMGPDEVFRLLSSIGRLSPLLPGTLGGLGPLGPLLTLPQGDMGAARPSPLPGTKSDHHGSAYS